MATALANRDLDVDRVRASLTTLAPDAVWDGASWDRLSLLAAAIAANPAIAESRANARAAAATARAARAGPALTLTLTGEYARRATESSPWLYGVTADAPLDFGARRSSRIGSADAAALAAHLDYAERVWSVRMALRRALAERFLATREVQIGEELGAVRNRQLAALEARLVAGEANRSEVERTRADAAADARRLSDAEARLVGAKIALAAALGIPLRSIDGAPLAWENFEAPPSLEASEALRRDALLMRADVLGAAAAYDGADADLRGAVARQWPEIHLGPGYTWERGLVKLPLAIGVQLPPLDLKHSAVRAAEAQRDAAAARLETIVAQAEAAIDAALAERSAADRALERVRGPELLAARRAAEQADEEIARGAIDRVDWCAAQAGLRLALLAEVDALRRVHAADASLEDSLRRPLSGPELAIASPPEHHD